VSSSPENAKALFGSVSEPIASLIASIAVDAEALPDAICAWIRFVKDSKMAHCYSFAIVRLGTNDAREERLNVGLAVFNGEKLDVRVGRRIDKVRALSAGVEMNTVRELISSLSKIDETLLLEKPLDIATRHAELRQFGPISLSSLGSFTAETGTDYESRVASILKAMVDVDPHLPSLQELKDRAYANPDSSKEPPTSKPGTLQSLPKDPFKGGPLDGYHPAAFTTGGGDPESMLSSGVKTGMLAAFREWFASTGAGGYQKASYSDGGGSTGGAAAAATQTATFTGNSDVTERHCFIVVFKSVQNVRLRQHKTHDLILLIHGDQRLSTLATINDYVFYCLNSC
jgi:Protein of unknown function (DUF3037)